MSSAARRCTSHSQTTNTRQPSACRARWLRRSRARLRRSLSAHHARLVRGMVDRRHPMCLCQKHPWTKTTDRDRGRTMSGRPGRDTARSLKRRPAACRARLTASSGSVSRGPIEAMIRERKGVGRRSCSGSVAWRPADGAEFQAISHEERDFLGTLSSIAGCPIGGVVCWDNLVAC